MHLFYGKKSIAIHGTEGEVVPQTNGQQDIEALISSEELKDLKVHVTNVDTLASIESSIIVQVIGEMSNNSHPSRRFTQTFLLAKQPGGYYLLNDILRYLKDDVVEREAMLVGSVVDAEAPPVAPTSAAHVKKDEKVDADDIPKQAEPAAVAAAVAEVLTPAAQIEAVIAVEPVAADPAPVAAAASLKSEPKPKTPREKPAASEAPRAEKPVAPVPTKPTTWANLAADGSNKWGNTISKVGGTVAPAAGAIAASDPSSRGSTPASGARDSRRKETFSVFLKNVPLGLAIAPIKYSCKMYGPVSHVEYIPTRNSAVVEFVNEAGKQAVLNAGTLMIAGNTVVVEERRQRPSSGRRDGAPAGGAGKSQQPSSATQGSGGAPPRNGSGEFERVGSSRGSRSRTSNSGSAAGAPGSVAGQAAGASQGGSRPRGAK
ncbi:hypothetical protein GGI04_004085 [Coemansia thaxteri]|uniref:NTF2 domain-containing protein n=1 Tax=Coemansia thaxteri TaxID=2663907 RepID=A0A9W8BEZ6_9FUNG|nr:hypothetical protein GGI04_004085 [Coemansia thaxteri]KAJ2004931.1 hypothetical protein H4R26_002241 [Coemansia thaxteri]KAJ2472588.1 hypothetical protein GGI02_001483 [Coemansia sp. RSA 2322]KAJ2483454.1 hypothetical protein EV174_002943 [Coemansia sp. RSA 2320]